MWPYLRKSTTLTDNNNNDTNTNINNNINVSNSDNNDFSPKPRRTPSSPNFKRRTFKDIEILTHDDDPTINTTTTTNVSHCTNMDHQSSQQSGCGSGSRPCVFHRVNLANRFTKAFGAKSKTDPYQDPYHDAEPEPSPKPSISYKKPGNNMPKVKVPGSEKRVVVYMTSLRAVRSTFEACRTVRSILQGFRVPVDERDLLMDSSFSDEIQKIMAQIGAKSGYNGGGYGKRVTLPRVFIGGRYIGGADEIVELHEIGELKKFVSGLPAVTPGVCEICGGFRFNLCEECNGSHKCPLEDGGFRVCTLCNENGLIRCPSCC